MSGIFPFEKPVFTLACPPFGEVRARVCRKITYDKIAFFLKGGCISDFKEIIFEIAPGLQFENITKTTAYVFLKNYMKALDDYFEKNADIFKVPEKVDFEEKEHIKFPIVTSPERLVYEHSGLDFEKINELDIPDYKLLLADSVKINILSRSDGKGREYLNECYEYMHKISDIFE